MTHTIHARKCLLRLERAAVPVLLVDASCRDESRCIVPKGRIIVVQLVFSPRCLY